MKNRSHIFLVLAATALLIEGGPFPRTLRAEEPKAAAETAPPKSTLPDLPTYVCRKTAAEIQIDGRLDEAVWRQTAAVQLMENSGTRGFLRPETKAKMLWNDQYLYIAFVAEDPDIQATLTRRDAYLWTEEVVEVFVGKPDHYVEIEVNPLNALFDGRIDIRGQTGRPRFDVDTIIKADYPIKHAVVVEGTVADPSDTDKRWVVEMAVPHVALEGIHSVPPKNGDQWSINLYRIEKSLENGAVKEAAGAWSPTAGWFHAPARFGKIVFRRSGP
jgi:hypothetical protein